MSSQIGLTTCAPASSSHSRSGFDLALCQNPCHSSNAHRKGAWRMHVIAFICRTKCMFTTTVYDDVSSQFPRDLGTDLGTDFSTIHAVCQWQNCELIRCPIPLNQPDVSHSSVGCAVMPCQFTSCNCFLTRLATFSLIESRPASVLLTTMAGMLQQCMTAVTMRSSVVLAAGG